MSKIVMNGKFHSIDQDTDTGMPSGSVDISADTNPSEIIERMNNVPAIRINFPSSADGRGFSIAKALRRAGYRGHLRASGHVLADQYPLALRSGFDDVEISDDLAGRQPAEQWIDALKRSKTGYRERLMHGASRTN